MMDTKYVFVHATTIFLLCFLPCHSTNSLYATRNADFIYFHIPPSSSHCSSSSTSSSKRSSNISCVTKSVVLYFSANLLYVSIAHASDLSTSWITCLRLFGSLGGCLYPQPDICNNFPGSIIGVPPNCIILFAIFSACPNSSFDCSISISLRVSASKPLIHCAVNQYW